MSRNVSAGDDDAFVQESPGTALSDEDQDFVMVPEMELPSTYGELKEKMSRFEATSWISGAQQLWSALTWEEQLIVKYCAPSLRIGRPLNKTVIMMCGQTGLGISSTMSSLFKHAAAPGKSSRTLSATEYGQVVQFDKLQTELVVVDLPGVLDPVNDQEVKNLALLQMYRQQRLSLEPVGMTEAWACQFAGMKVREKVYPNLVLFIVSCRDERMEGPASNLRRSLKLLRAYDIVDTSRPNLLVIATCAGSVPQQVYLERANRITEIVRRAVDDTFGICLEMVHLVENTGATPAAGGQFELIREEMVRNARGNSDMLAEHTLSHYYEAGSNFTLSTPKQFGVEPNQMALTTAMQLLCQKEILPSEEEIPAFYLQYLGRGYNCATCGVRNTGIVNFASTIPIDLNGKLWHLPKQVSVEVQWPQNQVRFGRAPVKHSAGVSGGGEAGVASSSWAVTKWEPAGLGSRTLGRLAHLITWWTSRSPPDVGEPTYAYVFEICLSRVRVDNAEEHLTPEFMEELWGLSGSWFYMWSCSDFFSKWGTSLICKESIGAYIQLVCTVQNPKGGNLEKQLAAFEGRVKTYLQMLRSANNKSTAAARDQELLRLGVDQDGVAMKEIVLSGRNRQPLRSLADLTRDLYRDWINEAAEHPSALNVQADDLIPFHQLLPSQQALTFAESTSVYLRHGYTYTWYGITDAIPIPSCFPASTLVLTSKGWVRIPRLGQNDRLITVAHTGSDVGTTNATSMCTFLHFDNNMVTRFLELECDNGAVLRISFEHLIFIVSSKGGQLRAVPAKSAVVGDLLIFCMDGGNGTAAVSYPRVVRIGVVLDVGVYAPLAQEGTFLANGFLVSCYAHTPSHALAHAALKPLRLWYAIKRVLVKESSFQPTAGIHKYAKFLDMARNWAAAKLFMS